MTPHLREICSLLFLPAIHSSRFHTLQGFFELTRRPSRAINLASCFAFGTSEIKGHVRCVALGADVPGPEVPVSSFFGSDSGSETA